MKPLLKKSQRGYSLIELSIALAIVGVVIAGSIVGVQAILTSNNVNKTIKQTNTAIGKIIAKLVRDTDYSNATLATLTTRGFDVWQDTEISGGGTSAATVTHYLGGNVFVKPVIANNEQNGGKQSYSVDTNQGLIYTLTGVPVGGCADLAGGLEGLATAMTIKNENSSTANTGTATNQWLVSANAVKDNNPGGARFNSTNVNSKCNGDGVSGAVGTATIAFLVQRR